MQQLLAPGYLTAALSLQRSSSDYGNVANCPGSRTVEAILQSILCALTPNRKYKDMTLTLAQRAVEVTAQITMLMEATKEAPQWPRHLVHLTEALLETQLFVQTETQCSVLNHDPIWETISNRYAAIEQRLTSVLNDVERFNTEIQACDSGCERVSAQADPIHTAQSQTPSSSSTNKADIVRSGEMFSNAHDLVIAGGQFYSGQICIQHLSGQESDQGIVPGIRVVAFEDISISREIHKTPMYRLHSDNGSRRARVVKVYQGPRAKERAQETARFHKKVMHPTFLHLVAVSPLSCEVPFLVFNGGFEGSLEVSIAKALQKDLQKSVILGLKTVIGLSSGLDYLRDIAYPFVNAGSQHFRAFLSLQEEVIISFDPDIAYERSNFSVNEQSSLLQLDKPLLIFHELCQQTFHAACKAHYEQQQGERTYDDTLEIEDFASFDYNYGDIQEIAPTHSISSTNRSFKKPLGRLPIDGHRRELVWKSQDEKNLSLEDISFEFKAFLDSLPPSSEPALHRRRGRYTVRTAHRCPGYNRTEITLTPSITRSAIVSHSTPLPHEICPVCNRVVQDVEIFDCICGGQDDESVPTIQCSKCGKWHHELCIDHFESTARTFTCPRCRRTQSKDPSMKYVIQSPDVKWPLSSTGPNQLYTLNMDSYKEPFPFDTRYIDPTLDARYTYPELDTRYTYREQSQLFRDAVALPLEGAGPFIPQPMHKPHTVSNPKRYVEDILLEAPIYFYLEHSDPNQCGISLRDALHSRVKNLANRGQFVFKDRGPSVSIRLEWPGYRQWNGRIPTKDFRSPPGPITVAKLAKYVAICVQRFILDRKSRPLEEGSDDRWRIGDGPHDIKLDDLMLVSIHHVSFGSWQPHLRLCRPQSNIS